MKRSIFLCITLFLLTVSPSWSNTTQAENDLLIRQAWRAGQQLIENGMYRRGVEYLEAYVKNRPRSADGWYWLAKGYQGMGMLNKAQKAFTQVLEVDPEYPPLSRVLQNRATGEAIPLMDPAGENFRRGLPVIETDSGIFNDRVIARPAPVDRRPIPSSPQPTMSIAEPYVPPEPVKPQPQVDERFSPLGARKVVVAPASKSPGTNPVVPIPPVANLMGEPEGPGIPMIRVPADPQPPMVPPVQAIGQQQEKPGEPLYAPPAPAIGQPLQQEKPVYAPPAPAVDQAPQQDQPVYVPPTPKDQ